MRKLILLAAVVVLLPSFLCAQTIEEKDTVKVREFSDLSNVTTMTGADSTLQFAAYNSSKDSINDRISIAAIIRGLSLFNGIIGSSQIVNGSILDTDISGSAGIGLNKLATTGTGRLLLTDSGGSGVWEAGTPGYGLDVSGTSLLVDTTNEIASKDYVDNLIDDVGGGGAIDSVFQTETKRREPFFTDFYNNPVTTHAGTADGDQFRDPSNIIQYEGKYYVYASRFDSASFAGDSSHYISVFESTSITGPFELVGNVLSRGTSGQWDDYAIFTPNAVVRQDTIWLFYTGSEGSRWSLGAAYSTNPTGTFTKYASNPILENGTDEGATSYWRNFRVDAATPIQLDNGDWRFYYKGVSSPDGSSVDERQLGYAAMTDAAFPVPTISQDTFFFSDADTYNSQDPEGPTVWLEGGYYYMIYATPASTGFEVVRSANGFSGWSTVDLIVESTIADSWSLGRWHGAAIYYDEATGTAPLVLLHDEAANDDVRQFGILVRNNFPIMPQESAGGGGSSYWTQSGSNIYYNSGNVGIGVASPSKLLDIRGSTLPGLYNRDTDLGYGNSMFTDNGGNYVFASNYLSGQDDNTKASYLFTMHSDTDSTSLRRFPAGGSISTLLSIKPTVSEFYNALIVHDTTRFEKFVAIEGASPIGFSIRNTAATFQSELSVGAGGNPNYIANWDNGSQSDASKVSWLLGLQVSNDRVVIQRAPAGGGFTNEALFYADSMVYNGDIKTNGGAFIDDGTTVGAPDYVFEDSYNFLPIRDYINTIKFQKHLIGARSARELKKEIPITQEMFANREAIENNVLYIEVLLDKIEQLEKRVKQLEQKQ